MPNNSDSSASKKPRRRIKPVVEEVVTPEPVPAPEPEPAVVETKPIIEPPTPTPAPEPVEEKAKQAISELETAHNEYKKSKRGINLKLLFGLTILIALIVGFVAGGFYVYTTGMKDVDNNTNNQTTETPRGESTSPTPTPQPTPSPEPVDVSDFSVSVLNGSGKIGEAGRVQDILEEAEFTVGNTGNASRYNYTDTIIQATESVPEVVLEQLNEVLSETYSVEIGDPLPETSTFDIVVTVGSTTN